MQLAHRQSTLARHTEQIRGGEGGPYGGGERSGGSPGQTVRIRRGTLSAAMFDSGLLTYAFESMAHVRDRIVVLVDILYASC